MAKVKFKATGRKLVVHPKAFYTVNPLTRSTGRIALLLDLLEHGVDRAQLESQVLRECEPRVRNKPVVVEDRRFDTVAAAACYLQLRYHPQANPFEAVRIQTNYRSQIRRWCNADDREGYYWAE